MGSSGITEIHGLQVAFLSGSYDATAFKEQWGRGLFTGAHYTAAAVERLEKQAWELRKRGGPAISCIFMHFDAFGIRFDACFNHFIIFEQMSKGLEAPKVLLGLGFRWQAAEWTSC